MANFFRKLIENIIGILMPKREVLIKTPLHTTTVVDTEGKCDEAMKNIVADCFGYNVVGLDAEWNHDGPRFLTRKIGKLQVLSICTPHGYCALIRLSKFRVVPKRLKKFLEDKNVTKAGVGVNVIASHMLNDYQVKVENYIELLEHANDCKQEFEERLGSQLQVIIRRIENIYAGRSLNEFDHRKWYRSLSPESIAFAAKDVHLFIEIYKQLHPHHEEQDIDHSWINFAFEEGN